jgi:cytochrome c biogenesis protein CcmG/thiol:disulfide interchange protein DsbE
VKRWLAFLPLVALVALAVLFAGWSLRRDPHVKPDAMVGKPVPAVMVARLDGGPDVSLAEAAKGPVLINAFASWCAPCRVEHPELMRLKAQGVRIVGVAWKDDPAKTRAFLEELGNPYDVVLTDQGGRAGIELGLSGVPETFAVDSRRVIVGKWASPMAADNAAALVRKAGLPKSGR